MEAAVWKVNSSPDASNPSQTHFLFFSTLSPINNCLFVVQMITVSFLQFFDTFDVCTASCWIVRWYLEYLCNFLSFQLISQFSELNIEH